MNFLLALILTSSLLTCPFRCMGHSLDGIGVCNQGETATKVSSSCHCCAQRSSSQQPDDDRHTEQEFPAGDCDCECLCKGGLHQQDEPFQIDLNACTIADIIALNALAEPRIISENDSHFLELICNQADHRHGLASRIQLDSFII